MLTFVLTVPIAGTLAQMPGHFVGTPVTGAAVPVFGWSREVGDLRTAHFLATHAMHFLPLAGLARRRAAARAAGRGPRSGPPPALFVAARRPRPSSAPSPASR